MNNTYQWMLKNISYKTDREVYKEKIRLFLHLRPLGQIDHQPEVSSLLTQETANYSSTM